MAGIGGIGGVSPIFASILTQPFQAVALRPGTDTATALAAGAWGLAVGGVDRLVEEALAALGGAPGVRVVATGGWGAAWRQSSRHAGIELDPALVHHGIRRWALA